MRIVVEIYDYDYGSDGPLDGYNGDLADVLDELTRDGFDELADLVDDACIRLWSEVPRAKTIAVVDQHGYEAIITKT